ncbi:MAG TPA: urease subunit beta [Amycolatopsis sp.]|jgi:urease subunit beta|nr:urease subunit beta [Amycolatopsis sp.]
MKPGEIIPGDGDIPLNPGAERVAVQVTNTGDRAVQVGSHYHFAAVNPALTFDRAAAWGYRLNLPAGKARRFEAKTGGDSVELVRIGEPREIPGLRPEYAGKLDERDHEPIEFSYGQKGEGPDQ